MKVDIAVLLASDDVTGAIIALDEDLARLCEWGDAMERLSKPQQYFRLNQNLEREVNNGGFDQYFFNSSGDFAHETLVALDAIQAPITSSLLSQAMSEFPGGLVPKDTDARRSLMLELWPDSSNPVWEALDERFCKYEENLNLFNISYVRAHVDEFQ
jgi:hypothetical protein